MDPLMKLVEALMKPDEDDYSLASRWPHGSTLGSCTMSRLELHHVHATLQVKNVSPITPSNRSLKIHGEHET